MGITGDQAFNFVGSDPLSAAGTVRSYIDCARTVIEGDVNGDGIADFQIVLQGVHLLQSDDFIL